MGWGSGLDEDGCGRRYLVLGMAQRVRCGLQWKCFLGVFFCFLGVLGVFWRCFLDVFFFFLFFCCFPMFEHFLGVFYVF